MLAARIQHFRRRHQRAILTTTAIVLLALVGIGTQVPAVAQLLIGQGIIAMATLFIVLEISLTVADLATREHDLSVARDQSADTESTVTVLRRDPVSRADMIEYSADTVRPILEELNRSNARIRLLVKHPDSVGPYQQNRIRVSLAYLFNDAFKDCGDRVQVRCYGVNASLRGRRFGDQRICVGWYTPDVDEPENEVRGHSNPVVSAPLSSREGQRLGRMFDGVFNRLWERDSQDLESVLRARHPPPVRHPRNSTS